MGVAIFFVALGFFLLVKGADLFVDNASGLAYRLKISSVVIGLTIVAFGTSMPELAVSVPLEPASSGSMVLVYLFTGDQ